MCVSLSSAILVYVVVVSFDDVGDVFVGMVHIVVVFVGNGVVDGDESHLE